MAIENEGGYDLEFVDKLNEGQRCSICLVAMRDTVQTSCGHRYCKNCLLRTFRDGNERICPQDRNRIPEEGGFFRDVGWDRDILSLRVKCKKSGDGCKWIGELRNHEKHLTTCQYEDVFCDDCDEVMQRMDLDPHLTFECPEREVQCDYCDELFAFRRIKDHEENKCARFPMDCPQNCGVKKPREELESHVQRDCSMTVVSCPYRGIGCIFYDNRCKLIDHIKESDEYHLRKSSKELIRVRQKLGGLEDLQESVEELKMENRRSVEELKMENSLMKYSLARNNETIKELMFSVEQLDQGNKALRKEIKRLSNKLAEVEEIKGNALSLDESVKEMNNVFEAMGDVLNRRKENEQSVTRNKRKKEDEVVRSSPRKRRMVLTSSSRDADESPYETDCSP